MQWERRFDELNRGDVFAPLIKKMTQEKINAYVSTAEDYNPIHVDADYAKTTPFKGTIAPGYQYMAYISELMAREFGSGWFTGGTLDIRLIKPVRPGDRLITRARVIDKEIAGGKKTALCEIRMTNQKGEDVIVGTAGASCR